MFGRTVQMVTVPPVVVNGPPASVTQIDPVAVGQALKARAAAGRVYVDALADYLQADAEYRAAFNEALIGASGPEYLRKAVAEQAAAEARAARDVAQRAQAAAEQKVRDAELGFRAAMAGAVADEAGERP